MTNNLSRTFIQKASQLHKNPSRVYLEEFVRKAAASLPADSRVLDAGAGDCPYQHLFQHVEYESADFCQVDNMPYGPITYVCDLTSIPVEENRYDLVLCTQVLEHLPEPTEVLKELYRVLKPGKELWCSAPLFYIEHQIPYDYYRYTQYGFRHILQKAGFEILEIDWMEGYSGTLSYQLRKAATDLPYTPKAYGGGLVGVFAAILAWILKPVFWLLSLLYERLDTRHKHTSTGMCKNHTVIARKPDTPVLSQES